VSEPKFTPGPWLPHLGYGPSSEIELYVNIDVPAEREDFKLIAAAPDLYKALANLEPYLDAIVCYASTIEEHPPNGFILETKAALAKARGER